MKSRIGRTAMGIIAGGALALSGFGIMGANFASATPVHTGCAPVHTFASSGWCGLYPGNATNNVQDLGQVSLSSNTTMLTIQTQSVDNGTAPRTSFACITSVPADQITHRLQDTQCTKDGGVWITWTGPSITVDMSQYPQFAGTVYTVQVAANDNAGNGNGDAFYNSFTVFAFGVG